jgi:hypothetical protein
MIEGSRSHRGLAVHQTGATLTHRLRRLRGPAARARRALLAVVASLAVGCASPQGGGTQVEALRAAIGSGDLVAADALLMRHPDTLDARRALDLAIRGGLPDAVRHYLALAGPDAELDPDATTPLIRTVLDAPAPARAALVTLLMQAGAQPDRADRYGRDARDYASARNRAELLPLMSGTGATVAAAVRPSATAVWFAAAAAGPDAPHAAPADEPSARVAARPARGTPLVRVADAGPVPRTEAAAVPGRADAGAATLGAATGTASSISRGSRTAGAGAPVAGRGAVGAPARGAPAEWSVAYLMRGSPWLPAVDARRVGVEVAALRFHADGVADLLRHRTGGARFEPMADARAVWRIDGDTLHVAIVGDAFSALCAGVQAPGGGLALSCEDRAVPPGRTGAYTLDEARAMLVAADPDATDTDGARMRAQVALATGRVPAGAESSAPAARSERVAVSLQPGGAPAACRPAKSRPRAVQPLPRVAGDWHVLDARRFDAYAPLSGAACPQPQARDAALAACRKAAGPGGAAACRSVGGCPAGQVSALAGLPGVDAGWVACDVSAESARRKALAACRADLGCDCQVVALSGRNLGTVPGAMCTAARAAAR